MSGAASLSHLLDVRDLSADGGSVAEPVPLLRGLSLCLRRGEVVGLVGESGSGKSLTALAMLGLLPGGRRGGVRLTGGSIEFAGQRLDGAPESVWRGIRARRIAMVFQEPMTALNPTRRVRDMMDDVLDTHRRLGRIARATAMHDCLVAMAIADTARVLESYPFQLSGGLRQRVLIAIGLMCEPELLIADEITTALDVTVQAQVLALLLKAARERSMALLLISHDLALVRHTCERVIVMLKGRVIESGRAGDVIERPRHPYTRALVDALPETGTPRQPLLPALREGSEASEASDTGCAFAARCERASPACAAWPAMEATQAGPDHAVRCWHPLETVS